MPTKAKRRLMGPGQTVRVQELTDRMVKYASRAERPVIAGVTVTEIVELATRRLEAQMSDDAGLDAVSRDLSSIRVHGTLAT